MLKNKINIIFLINDMFINNFEILYNKMLKNDIFEVKVVSCESKSTDYKKFISSKNICKFLKSNKINCIDGYNPFSKKYIDLNQFNPDYIFVSNPYDIYRPNEYSSEKLSKIAKLCDIEYGTSILLDNGSNMNILENSYYSNCYMHFISNNYKNYISKEFDKSKIKNKFIPVGCLKVEKFLDNNYKSNNWNNIFENNESLRIVWKPRWTLSDLNLFFLWLEKFIELSSKMKIQLLILEHPLLKSNLEKKQSLKLYENIIKKCDKDIIKTIDNYDFLDYVLESDVLICEPTSLVAEYSITNNPILLQGNYEELNGIGKKIIKKKNIGK